jgi:hypothetical protein
VIAELLLIVITVSIGTLVYSFASTAFGGFGAGFSNLVQEAGNQLAENVVVEQIHFFVNGTVGGDLYLRNVGANTAVVLKIYVVDISPTGVTTVVASATEPYLPANGLSMAPGTSATLKFTFNSINLGDTYAFTLVTGRGNQVVGYEKA